MQYHLKNAELIGENIVVVSNYGLPKSDTYYFSSAIVNLKENSAFAKDTKIEMNKNIGFHVDPCIACQSCIKKQLG